MNSKNIFMMLSALFLLANKSHVFAVEPQEAILVKTVPMMTREIATLGREIRNMVQDGDTGNLVRDLRQFMKLAEELIGKTYFSTLKDEKNIRANLNSIKSLFSGKIQFLEQGDNPEVRKMIGYLNQSNGDFQKARELVLEEFLSKEGNVNMLKSLSEYEQGKDQNLSQDGVKATIEYLIKRLPELRDDLEKQPLDNLKNPASWLQKNFMIQKESTLKLAEKLIKEEAEVLSISKSPAFLSLLEEIFKNDMPQD